MSTPSIARINELFQQAVETHEQTLEQLAAPICSASQILTSGLLDGAKIFTCGNGESAIEAASFSASLLGRFDRERPGLPAVCLNTATPTITAVSGDQQLDQIYARQIHALADDKDILAVFTTHGQAPEICRAIEAAHQYKLPVILFSGSDGGQAALMLESDDIELRVSSRYNGRIRETQLLLVHCLCDLIENELFG